MDALVCLEWIKSLFSTELVSAFIGAIIGGLFTMWATTRAHNLTARAVSASDEALLYDTVKLIQVEITTALKVFREEYGDELLMLPDNSPYVCTFPIGGNPFPIYDSSPMCLSRLPAELSELIVRIYMRAKGLIAMIEMNNADAERARELAQNMLNEKISQIGTFLTSDAADRVSQLYEADVISRATIIGMGATAEGMKSLTKEMLDLMERANKLIDDLPKPPAR